MIEDESLTTVPAHTLFLLQFYTDHVGRCYKRELLDLQDRAAAQLGSKKSHAQPAALGRMCFG